MPLVKTFAGMKSRNHQGFKFPRVIPALYALKINNRHIYTGARTFVTPLYIIGPRASERANACANWRHAARRFARQSCRRDNWRLKAPHPLHWRFVLWTRRSCTPGRYGYSSFFPRPRAFDPPSMSLCWDFIMYLWERVGLITPPVIVLFGKEADWSFGGWVNWVAGVCFCFYFHYTAVEQHEMGFVFSSVAIRVSRSILTRQIIKICI